jgi:hypothetical protein
VLTRTDTYLFLFLDAKCITLLLHARLVRRWLPAYFSRTVATASFDAPDSVVSVRGTDLAYHWVRSCLCMWLVFYAD